MKRTIAKNTGIISLGTNVSRFLGLIRDVLIARLFGTSQEAGAFVVAFTIPNMLRDFVGEGAANTAFVPVLTEYKVKKGKDEFWKVANIILNFLTLALIAISLIGILFAPAIARLMAPGFVKEADTLAMTVRLTRVIFPYILFIGLAAYMMGVLNTLGHFAAPAFSAGLLNIALILCALFLCPFIGVMGLAVGALLGGVLQLIAQIPFLIKKGFTWRNDFSFFHPAAKKIGFLLFPRVIGSAVYQINILVDRMLASLFWIVGEGGIPALYFAYRLIQYPLAVFSTALATATLPLMSRQVVENDILKFKNTVFFSLKSIFFIMIPSSAGLIVLGKPIIQILFQRGLFNIYSTSITYQALIFYSIGLFAYGGIRILATSFYSMNDTVTPVKVAACSLIVNVIFSVILMWPLKIGGLALATSISAIFNFAALFIALRKKLGGFEEKEMLVSIFKITLATVPMCIISYFSQELILCNSALKLSAISAVGILTGTVLISILVFLTGTFCLGIEEPRKLVRWILRKR